MDLPMAPSLNNQNRSRSSLSGSRQPSLRSRFAATSALSPDDIAGLRAEDVEKVWLDAELADEVNHRTPHRAAREYKKPVNFKLNVAH